jgi:prepilin-type N-terminal cleavage/methylation domain-containing protein
MSTRFDKPWPSAFTLVELLIVIGIIAILFAFLLPARTNPDRARQQLRCLINQKQIGIGLIMFSGDHQDAFPMSVSISNGGVMEPLSAGDVMPCYVILTNMALSPNVFHCYSDKSRLPAQVGQPITRTNVSYFISLDASPTTSPSYSILTGDRHLSADSKPIGQGLFTLTTTQALAWTTELHNTGKTSPGGGAFSFADGHGEFVLPKNLWHVIARQTSPTKVLAFP